MMNQSAQGLASLGRGNDSMLVHMTPREVQGLQGLAMAHGGSLSINPQTGLPEAGFLDAVLPMAAGFALGPGGFGLFQGANAALMTGLTVGGLTALASGDLGKGLMAGFGAYGGSGLGEAVKNFGSRAAIPGAAPTGEVVKQAIDANKINVMNPSGAPGVNVFSGAGAPGVKLPTVTQPYSGITGSTGQIGANLGSTMPRAAIDTGGLDAVSTDVLSGSDFGKLDYSLGTNTVAPQTLSQGFSNVMDNPSGFAQSYGPGKLALQAAGPALSLLEPPIPKPYEDPDKDKYRGPQGQLNLSDQFDTGLRLVAKGGAIKSYAIGGAIDPNLSVGGGLSDLYNRPEGATTQSNSQDGYGLGRLSQLGSEQARFQAQTLGYADGGDVGMNLDKLPTLNVNTGRQGYSGGSGDGTNFLRALLAREDENSLSGRIFGGLLDNINNLPNPFAAMSGAGRSATPSYSLNVNTGKQEAQGKAQGGYLDGQGDGMSDSIPATIEGKQPARLADGEFVVPADVVSHLGNGSSKAGSKRLYAMLDKVRHARTGNKKQGKEIKADKYLPA